MTRTISDLREKLFETIDALNDQQKPLDVARAHAVVKVAEAIIESAKVEVKALELHGAGTRGTGFLGVDAAEDPKRPLLGHERLSAVKGK